MLISHISFGVWSVIFDFVYIILRLFTGKHHSNDQRDRVKLRLIMMTSWNGHIFRVTGHLWGEFTGHWWITLTKGSDAELWCYLWSATEQTVEQTIETQMIWDAITPIITSLQWQDLDEYLKWNKSLTKMNHGIEKYTMESFTCWYIIWC